MKSPIQEFANFHSHTHFSTMDGIATPEELVVMAKHKGLKSIALTDHGVAHGHADFYLAGKKHGVKTVLGVEAYVIHDLEEWNVLRQKLNMEKKLDVAERDSNSAEEVQEEKDKLVSKQLYRKGHLVLLACNQKGLANIYRLTFRAHKEGFYSKPRMDKRMLAEHAEGLVATSACMGGVISNACWDLKNGRGTWEDVIREAKEFDRIFGRGRFFLELQLNESDSQRFINDCLVRVHQETGIPLTVAMDCHYTRPEEWQAQELLYMLRSKKTISTRGDKWNFEVKQLYVKSPEEMWQSFLKFGGGLDQKIAIEAFQNTLLIDSLIDSFEPDTHQRLPTLPYKNPFAEMGQRAIDGLKKLGLADRDEYKQQMLHELKVIKQKGISNYFLIVQRMLNEARKTQCVGAGRGSAAGSLVCYALGITDLDPLEHELMFERFLDPDRSELPDIDVDFQDVYETKEMLRQIFGADNVACLSTYGTFQVKGLLKDLGRAYDIDHNEINKLNRQIEKELRVLYVNQDKSTIVIKLDDIKRVSPTFNKFLDQYPDVGQHLTKLYGRIRHVGRHAAGVIIGDDLPSETATWWGKDTKKESPTYGQIILHASFTEGIVNKNISAMGFVKFDILSIAGLKVIDHALRLISTKTGTPYEELKESIRPHRMNLNDPKVLQHVFWKGNFAGIFQFTEKGIRRLGMKVKPDTFTEVSAITSIYRPGPLGGGFDKLFVENKHNPEGVTYDHPLLESILKKTKGCIVFQEQLMKICNVLGKMSMKDVNRVRKVLLKKDKSKSEEFLKKENDELSGKFLKGCTENGMDPDKAKELWDKLLKFGGYGFNKAHSDAYTVMTMQMAYLATYYPLEFYSALLTKGQAGELQDYVTDIKRCGIKILPVDINKSKLAHTVEGENSIRLSFSSVNGLGPAAIQKIVANQPYTDFIDFLDRSGASKTAISPLIKVGAFDTLFKNVRELERKYEIYAANPKFKTQKQRLEWLKIWSEPEKFDDYQPHEKVELETELMGFTARGSPFEILDREKKITAMFDNVVTEYREFLESEMEVVALPVILKDIKERPQRNGKMFAFLKFATQTGEEFEAPCFANIWEHIGSGLKKGAVYITTFNRKIDEDPQNLLVGRPGFRHSKHSSQGYMINVDEVQL